MIFCFIFYFRPEEPAAPVLTSPADSLRDSRYGPRRGRTQQAGAAPHGLGADAPQEDHYSGLAAPPSEMCRRKIGDDAAVMIFFFFDKKVTGSRTARGACGAILICAPLYGLRRLA